MLRRIQFGFIFFAVALMLAGSTFAASIRNVRLKLISPKPGDVLVAGQTVQVKWKVRIPKGLDLTWCEQETFLSIDGGQTFRWRISGQLSPKVTSFDWVVPDLPTGNAVLNLHFGTDGGPGREERSHIQRKNSFRIVSPSVPPQAVVLQAVSKNQARPGDDVKLSWRSSVKQVDRYEVLVSYNAGGHFNLIGKTNSQDFSWQVPSAFAGHATFKVVAVTRSGLRIESGVRAKPQVIVQ
jgi:hypothetical protein